MISKGDVVRRNVCPPRLGKRSISFFVSRLCFLGRFNSYRFSHELEHLEHPGIQMLAQQLLTNYFR
jgi:hypothetical protein